MIAGNCLQNVGVKAMDTRDALGRGRFFTFLPEFHLHGNAHQNHWYWRYIHYPTELVSTVHSW